MVVGRLSTCLYGWGYGEAGSHELDDKKDCDPIWQMTFHRSAIGFP